MIRCDVSMTQMQNAKIKGKGWGMIGKDVCFLQKGCRCISICKTRKIVTPGCEDFGFLFVRDLFVHDEDIPECGCLYC